MADRNPLQFPCEFHLKVVGRSGDFEIDARRIVSRHVGDLDATSVRSRPSRDGRFVSLTFRFAAESRDQLDALYHELGASEQILMVL